MNKRTDTTINIFIDKLDKSGVGVSLMQNENVWEMGRGASKTNIN